jgi:hypothetical protein
VKVNFTNESGSGFKSDVLVHPDLGYLVNEYRLLLQNKEDVDKWKGESTRITTKLKQHILQPGHIIDMGM